MSNEEKQAEAMKPIEQYLHDSSLPKRAPDEVQYLKQRVGELRIALAEIEIEARGALNNAFPEEAPDVLANVAGIARLAISSTPPLSLPMTTEHNHSEESGSNFGIKCQVCGRFIPYKDLGSGDATHRMDTPDSHVSSESWTTLCKDHNK